MTKIYEALENADKERGEMTQGEAPRAVRSTLPRPLEEKLLALYQRVEASSDAPGGRVVAIVGVHTGPESSSLACEFARLVAGRLLKKVLLLAAYPSPYPNAIFTGAGSEGWEDVVEGRASLDDVIAPSSDDGLQVGNMSVSEGSLPSVLASSGLSGIIDSLRERFDLVLVDAPPLAASSDAALLSPAMDGTVVVVEAGKTRWQVARNGIEQIQAQGGTVLGTILNKRRQYIPGFIYRKL